MKYYLMEIEGDTEDSKARPNPRITVRENRVVEGKVLWPSTNIHLCKLEDSPFLLSLFKTPKLDAFYSIVR